MRSRLRCLGLARQNPAEENVEALGNRFRQRGSPLQPARLCTLAKNLSLRERKRNTRRGLGRAGITEARDDAPMTGPCGRRLRVRNGRPRGFGRAVMGQRACPRETDASRRLGTGLVATRPPGSCAGVVVDQVWSSLANLGAVAPGWLSARQRTPHAGQRVRVAPVSISGINATLSSLAHSGQS